MSDTPLRYEPSVPMHQDHRGGWVKVRDYERLRDENKAAWDSAEYNAQRARDAEKRIEELEAQFCTSCGRRIGSGFKLCPECWCEQEESDE